MNHKMNYQYTLNYENMLPAGDVWQKSMENLGPSGGPLELPEGTLKWKCASRWGRVTKIETPKKTWKYLFSIMPIKPTK